MVATSEASESERDRYERVYTVSAKLLVLLQGGLPEDSLDLVVEMVNALVKDAVELEVSASYTGQDAWRREFVSRAINESRATERQQLSPSRQVAAQQAATARIARAIERLASIGSQLEGQQRIHGRALSDAKAAFRDLTAGDRPSTALLVGLTRAIREVRTCAVRLERLGYELTAVIPLASSNPRMAVDPPFSAMPATGLRDAAAFRPGTMAMPVSRDIQDAPGNVVPAPRFPDVTASPATTIQPPRYDRVPGGSFRAC